MPPQKSQTAAEPRPEMGKGCLIFRNKRVVGGLREGRCRVAAVNVSGCLVRTLERSTSRPTGSRVGRCRPDDASVAPLQLPLKAVLDHSQGQYEKRQRSPSLSQSCRTNMLSTSSASGTWRRARDTTGKTRRLIECWDGEAAWAVGNPRWGRSPEEGRTQSRLQV